MTGKGWMMALALVLLALGALGAPASSVFAQDNGLIPQDKLDVGRNLSQKEMVGRASEDINRMKGIREQVLTLLEETREQEKDLLKLNCINEKLAAIKGFLKVSEQSATKLQETGDKESAVHQFSLITIASQKVQNLGVEAQSCAGEVLRYSGNTESITEVDPEIAELDPFVLLDELNRLFRLPEVTPYQ